MTNALFNFFGTVIPEAWYASFNLPKLLLSAQYSVYWKLWSSTDRLNIRSTPAGSMAGAEPLKLALHVMSSVLHLWYSSLFLSKCSCTSHCLHAWLRASTSSTFPVSVDITVTQLHSIVDPNNIEALCLDIMKENCKSFSVLCCYRPPSSDNTFFTSLEAIIAKLDSSWN